jgi:Na+-driven multidrug efflux pump
MFTMSKATFVMMAIMIIPLSFEMNYILGIWLGNKVPEYTQQFATLIIFSMFPRNMIMVLSQVVHASGKMKTYQLGSAAVILLALPLSYLLLKSGNSPVLIYVSNIVLFVLFYHFRFLQ